MINYIKTIPQSDECAEPITVYTVTNNSESEKGIALPRYNDIVLFITDKDNNLTETKAISNQIKLTPKSVTTVVMK
jgi:hypothetical protein